MEKIVEKKEIKRTDKSQSNVFDGDSLLKTFSKFIDVNKTLSDVLKENGELNDERTDNNR